MIVFLKIMKVFSLIAIFAKNHKVFTFIVLLLLVFLFLFFFALFLETTSATASRWGWIPVIGPLVTGKHELVTGALNRMLGWWESALSFLQGPVAIAAVFALIGAIGKALHYSINKLSKEKGNHEWAIVFSTGVAVILMLPMFLAINGLLGSQLMLNHLNTRHEAVLLRQEMYRQLHEHQQELAALREQATRLSHALTGERINTRALEDRIRVLTHSQLNMQEFERIVQVALLRTQIKQTLVHRAPIGNVGFLYRNVYTVGPLGGRTPTGTENIGFWQDEALIIDTVSLTAIYGVDLTAIKLEKISDDTIELSGFQAIFMGMSYTDWNNQLMEARTRYYDLRGNLTNVTIFNPSTPYFTGGDHKGKLISPFLFAENERNRNNFYKRLSSFQENSHLNTVVIELAQNFLRVMLSPLYENILFTDTAGENALPIFEFLSREINVNQEALAALIQEQEEIDRVRDQLVEEAMLSLEIAVIEDQEASALLIEEETELTAEAYSDFAP